MKCCHDRASLAIESLRIAKRDLPNGLTLLKALSFRLGNWVALRMVRRNWRNMLGWMILFALMTLPGIAAALTGYPVAASLKTMSAIFALLLIISLLTRVVRGRAS